MSLIFLKLGFKQPKSIMKFKVEKGEEHWRTEGEWRISPVGGGVALDKWESFRLVSTRGGTASVSNRVLSRLLGM